LVSLEQVGLVFSRCSTLLSCPMLSWSEWQEPTGKLLLRSRSGLDYQALKIDALLARPDIDLVYIATPPFLHHPRL